MSNTTPRILIVGGGYAGFYTAWKLEKHLRRGEAQVTIVDPLPYMTYQPFLPEVAAGSIEARHSVVSLRRHLKRTRVVTAKITGIDHANKVATVTPALGEPWQEEYDRAQKQRESYDRAQDLLQAAISQNLGCHVHLCTRAG